MEDIREILGLPPDTPLDELKKQLKTLKAEHEELLGLKGQWEAREKAELEVTQWQALYKSEDWLGCWIGLSIIAAAIFLFSFTGLTYKAPSFRWTTDREFQSHTMTMAPVVDQIIQQASAKGEAALQEQARPPRGMNAC